jgi:deazaflavin-dependent oxidoreductase (nitroreductase family)
VSDDELAARIVEIYRTPGSLDALNADIVAQFRANGGQIVSGPLAGAPLLLLTLHHGVPLAGSVTRHQDIYPLAYMRQGDGFVVAASKGGEPENPSWYGDLLAAGTATIEVGTESFPVSVSEVTGAERDRLYAALAAELPMFARYAARTTRVIPVLVLARRGG